MNDKTLWLFGLHRNKKVWQATERANDITNSDILYDGLQLNFFVVGAFQEDNYVGACVLYAHRQDITPEGFQSRIFIFDTKVRSFLFYMFSM